MDHVHWPCLRLNESATSKILQVIAEATLPRSAKHAGMKKTGGGQMGGKSGTVV